MEENSNTSRKAGDKTGGLADLVAENLGADRYGADRNHVNLDEALRNAREYALSMSGGQKTASMVNGTGSRRSPGTFPETSKKTGREERPGMPACPMRTVMRRLTIISHLSSGRWMRGDVTGCSFCVRDMTSGSSECLKKVLR